jgi:hypothetical protein
MRADEAQDGGGAVGAVAIPAMAYGAAIGEVSVRAGRLLGKGRRRREQKTTAKNHSHHVQAFYTFRVSNVRRNIGPAQGAGAADLWPEKARGFLSASNLCRSAVRLT